ncbi:M14 family metallopeptidase [uncultured Roseivirga sp.]|uniref:M14 family metallopeptidase n=1 Tax=uncultured Roseivirga sp. TaxID=543088 RepID=UPI0030DCF1F9|tara:strand:- start:1069 stop:2688 length:1620 start_codon:yes stop_codon:yes gene_type:complete
MNQKVKKWVLGALFLFSVSLQAQDYNNANQLAQRLKQLAGSSPDVKLESITKTDGGKDIWMLTLGKGDVDSKPAIAVIGGVEGAHVLGVEMAVRFAEGIVKDNASVLDHTTFYVFPNMSPDATEQYFAKLKYERSGNAKQTDDDRDGKLNEDPFEDLNGDGIITWMRVEDATGDWITHPADSRVMIKANKTEGEKGKYKIFTEGMDNDKDGSFNEDGEGGVHFRKNLTYEYPYFVAGSGEHSVSEKENRALLDLLYTKWNLYGVFTFGPGNNLSSPWKFNRAGASKRVVTSILSEDADLNKFISDAYNKTTGMKNAPASGEQGGDFLQWAYFHFGRLSLGTPGWWAPTVKDEEGAVANKDKNQEVNFLRWAAQENLSNYFVDWKEISHPDFPNQKVEVGGIAPFKMNNPPMSMVEEASKKNNDFIVELVGMQADVKLVNLKSEAVGKGMTRITVDVYNAGTLPTHTQMGTRSRWLRPIIVELKLGKDQEAISGRKIMTINNLDGDGSQQFTWLVKGKGSVQIEAGAPHAGVDNVTVNLK